jgi:hypothetical protein
LYRAQSISLLKSKKGFVYVIESRFSVCGAFSKWHVSGNSLSMFVSFRGIVGCTVSDALPVAFKSEGFNV